ncbi:MAG: hypothetical protein LBS97_06800 [Treponema sp.]|nr:hypothetical protein [Treponema sp.]
MFFILGVGDRAYRLWALSLPSAEAAVKIAQTLGVSVEYLITGRESQGESQARASRLHAGYFPFFFFN